MLLLPGGFARDFTRVRSEHFQPAIEEGMREQRVFYALTSANTNDTS